MSRYEKFMQNNPQKNLSKVPTNILKADFQELAERFNQVKDPRPDLESDSELWLMVLAGALELYPNNQQIYGILHGVRCGGASLVENSTSTGLRLLPGEWTSVEWEVNKRRYLDGIKEQIKEVFSYASVGVARNRLADPVVDAGIGPEITGEQQRIFGLVKGGSLC